MAHTLCSGGNWRRFLEIAGGWQRAELARACIARLRREGLPATVEVDGRSLAEWIDWAEAKAEAFDPVDQGLERIFSDIARIEAWMRVD